MRGDFVPLHILLIGKLMRGQGRQEESVEHAVGWIRIDAQRRQWRAAASQQPRPQGRSVYTVCVRFCNCFEERCFGMSSIFISTTTQVIWKIVMQWTRFTEMTHSCTACGQLSCYLVICLTSAFTEVGHFQLQY